MSHYYKTSHLQKEHVLQKYFIGTFADDSIETQEVEKKYKSKIALVMVCLELIHTLNQKNLT